MYPYISITDQEIEEMLKTIGISSTDELYSDIPENVQFKGELNIPKAKVKLKLEDISTKFLLRTHLLMIRFVS